MILFAFSMPPAMPKDMMTKLTATATTTQTFAPHALAVALKVATIPSMSCPMADRPPSNARNVYLKIQPITQV